jgi:general stress protein YciG
MVSELMRQMGKKGGKRRLKTMTAEERQEVARKAGKASAEARRKGK